VRQVTEKGKSVCQFTQSAKNGPDSARGRRHRTRLGTVRARGSPGFEPAEKRVARQSSDASQI